MCKFKKDVSVADPTPRPSPRTPRRSTFSSSTLTAATTFSSSSTSFSSATTLSSLRDSLPDRPTLYRPSEIASATSNFHPSRRLPSSSSGWRCTLRGRSAVVFLRPFRRGPRDASRLIDRLASVSRGHHVSLVRLIGAAASSDGGNLYVAYEYLPGASLAACLRNPKNPEYTVLSTWMSRVQIAVDLAQGLEYIHNHAAAASPAGNPDRRSVPFVHNRIKSSAVIVTEPSFNAKICHFGTAVLSGEVPDNAATAADPSTSETRRSKSRTMKIEGSRGYMAPEVGISQKSDVYALGVVFLELLSGEEPLQYKMVKAKDELERVSLIESARRAMESTDEDERRRNVRRWVDGRLKDSFPVEVAERMARVALECVHEDPEERPDSACVAGFVSKLYLESMVWEKNVRVPVDLTVSMGPR